METADSNVTPPPSPQQAMETHTEPSAVQKKKKTKAPLLFSEWLPNQTGHVLKVKDIRQLGKGKSIRLAVFDRNVGDAIDEALQKGKIALNRSYKVHSLLKKINHVATFTKGDKLSGIFAFEGTEVSGFSFDTLKRRQNCWIPSADAGGLKSDSILGYRGYIIDMNKINKSDKVRIVQDASDIIPSFR